MEAEQTRCTHNYPQGECPTCDGHNWAKDQNDPTLLRYVGLEGERQQPGMAPSIRPRAARRELRHRGYTPEQIAAGKPIGESDELALARAIGYQGEVIGELADIVVSQVPVEIWDDETLSEHTLEALRGAVQRHREAEHAGQ